MTIQDKYQIRIKRLTEMERAELRFLNEGISIANEYKSILICYNELKDLVLDEKLFLQIFYIKNYDNGVTYNYEIIECNEELFNIISKKTKIKVRKIKVSGKLEDKLILKGMCKLRQENQGENEFYLSHRKLMIKNDVNDSIVIPLDTISCIQKEGNSSMKLLYNNIVQELYYPSIDVIIRGIIDNKFDALKYADNLNTEQKTVKVQKKLTKGDIIIFVFSIVLLILGIILILKSL